MDELFAMLEAGRTDPLMMAVLADRLAEGQDAATILAILRRAVYLDIPRLDSGKLSRRAKVAINAVIGNGRAGFPIGREELVRLAEFTALDILQVKNTGPVTLKEINRALALAGLSLKETPPWHPLA
jgi:hypothetical protein